jgi:hypothetical protein
MNPAGYIKEYTRPFWLDPNYTEYGSTYFEHDTRGRLLHIKDGPSLASPYTDLELHYQRPTGRSYLVADFPVVRKDLSNPEALKTVTYTVRYQTGREETYKQDYIYNGSEIDAWVTAYSSADGTRRDDWRLAESTSIQGRRAEYSYRRYHWQLPAASAVQKFDYRVKNEFTLYGKVWETYGERNFSSAFDFAFGTAIAVSQEGRKSTFRDFRTVDPMTQLPGVSHMVSEDTASTATGAVPGGYALYRRFIHNAAASCLESATRCFAALPRHRISTPRCAGPGTACRTTLTSSTGPMVRRSTDSIPHRAAHKPPFSFRMPTPP